MKPKGSDIVTPSLIWALTICLLATGSANASLLILEMPADGVYTEAPSLRPTDLFTVDIANIHSYSLGNGHLSAQLYRQHEACAQRESGGQQKWHVVLSGSSMSDTIFLDRTFAVKSGPLSRMLGFALIYDRTLFNANNTYYVSAVGF